jgi:hypothetical protein
MISEVKIDIMTKDDCSVTAVLADRVYLNSDRLEIRFKFSKIPVATTLYQLFIKKSP